MPDTVASDASADVGYIFVSNVRRSHPTCVTGDCLILLYKAGLGFDYRKLASSSWPASLYPSPQRWFPRSVLHIFRSRSCLSSFFVFSIGIQWSLTSDCLLCWFVFICQGFAGADPLLVRATHNEPSITTDGNWNETGELPVPRKAFNFALGPWPGAWPPVSFVRLSLSGFSPSAFRFLAMVFPKHPEATINIS